MKANGMKAWRKAARRWRRKQNRRSGAPYTDGTGRWYRRQQAWFHQRPAVPHRPFTPRSLVGMTMGARKRAARACPGCIECLNEIPSVDHGVRCDSSGAFATAPARLRTKYRIGQRLRPCPGRHGCRNCTRTRGACEDQFPDDARCRRTGSVVTTKGPYCDGSGVIPARPRVNQGKPLAVEPADDLG